MSNKYSDGDYQRRVDDFIRKHILYCVSTLVSDITDAYWRCEGGIGDLTEDEIFDINRCPPDEGDCLYRGFEIKKHPEEGYFYVDEDDHHNGAFYDTHENAVEACVIEQGIDGSEVYEHWLIDDRLARWLKDAGGHVVEFMGLDIWCRTTTGQSIILDRIICDIYDKFHDDEGNWRYPED